MPRRSRFRAVLAIWLDLFHLTISSFAVFVASVALADGSGPPTQKTSPLSSPIASPLNAVVTQYCLDCHSKELKKGDLDLEALCATGIESSPEAWEKVARKLRARQMPPPGKKRPDE